MNKVIVVVLGLLLAVHVSVPGLPAPVPVLLVLAAVIGTLCHAIWVASGCRIEWRAAT